MSPSTLPWPQWFFYVSFRWFWRSVLALSGGLRVEGLEHLPGRGPVILAPNHVSLMDPWIMCAACPNPLRSLAAEYLYAYPLLGPYLYAMGAFPIKQGQSDPAGLGKARQLLAGGATVMIFPEGGCSPDGRPRPWLPGVALLSIRSRAPVIPVVIEGSRRLLPLGSWRLNRTPVKVTFLAPLPAPALSAGGLRHQVSEHLIRLQRAWAQGANGV